MKKILFASVVLTLGICACSTAKVRVLPGEDGVNRVEARDIERDGAEEASYKAAEDYCKDQNKHAVYLKDQKGTEYTGNMNENTRKTVRNASKAAVLLSPVVGVAGRSTPAGAILGGAGMTGYAMTNDRDYKSDLQFKCQ